jgi:hypothetical protein
MKKILTLFLLLFFIGPFLKAQTNFDLYGVCLMSDTPAGGVAFTKINPNSGNLTVQSKWSKTIHTFGVHTLDPKNKMYYQVTTDPWNMFILKIDMNTGIIADTVFTLDSLGTGDSTVNWISGDINGLFYNCVDECVYFLYSKKNNQVDNSSTVGTRLAKVDPITGKASLVTILPPDLYGGEQRCAKNQQKIFLHSYYTNNELIVYDLQTKQLSSIVLSKNYNSSQYVDLIMNTSDNQLYGYETDNSTFTSPKFMSTSQMIKVNPVNGLVTGLSIPFALNVSGTLSFEPTNNKLYFMGLTSNPGTIDLFSFDIYTKKQVVYNTTNVPDAYLFVGIHIIGDNRLDSAFICKNTCQNIPAEFYPTTRDGSLEWDFGDPASGSLNTSNQINPQHTYSQPGTYTVKMTSSNCWRSNTVIKTITIGSFPEIDLGKDINWCLNKKHEELYLHVNATGVTYLWQDLTTADNYTVSKAGMYWVKVMNTNCVVSDTLIVNELPCSCDITVLPTLTHAVTSFIFDCDLSTFNPLVLELYNEGSQIVLRRQITATTTIVNFEEFATGIYFYRIRDKNSVLKAGKVVFVK